VYMPYGDIQEAKPTTRSWLLLALLGVAYAFAYFDRQLLNLLVDPIRHSLGLSDTQIGLVQGVAFAFCFAIGGVPLGWLADNVNRIRVAGGCIVAWSLATSSTGFAASYGQLLVARSVTALAEAGCSPAATSIFSDVFPPRLLPRAIAIYMTAPFIGGGAALFAGGYTLRHFEATGGITLPWLGHLVPWQSVFATLALPGLLLAVIVLTLLREPVRTEIDRSSARTITFAEMFRFVFEESRYLLSYFGAYACILAAFFSLLTWYPTFAIRSGFGNAATIGREVGLIFLVCGLIGTLGAQWLVGQVRDTEVVPRILRVAVCALWVLVAVSLMLCLPLTAKASLASYGLFILSVSVLTSLMPIPLQVGVPNRMRGRLVGLFIMSINLIGAGLGPLAVGRMSDAFGSSAHALLIALAGVLLLSNIAALALMLRANSRLKTDTAVRAAHLLSF
jgi:MFS family permease